MLIDGSYGFHLLVIGPNLGGRSGCCEAPEEALLATKRAKSGWAKSGRTTPSGSLHTFKNRCGCIMRSKEWRSDSVNANG